MAELRGLEVAWETIGSAAEAIKDMTLLVWHVWLYEFINLLRKSSNSLSSQWFREEWPVCWWVGA